MKVIFYSAFFLLLATAIIFVGDHYYDVYHMPANGVSSDVSNESNKEKTNSINKSLNSGATLLSNTPPHFLAGFDWNLPAKTKITKNSGLTSDQGHNPGVANNRFIIVKWDESNPKQGQYDFSKLDAHLKRIAPQHALIRLEVNSSCEAPKWALNKLRQTKQKSLIFWDKNYSELTSPFIQKFADRYAAHEQIIGVQLGLADGEFGEESDSCNDYGNKQGWGEFWMSPSERNEAENQFGFNPKIFAKAAITNIDIYANAFGIHKNKLAFTNLGTLFTYGEGSEPYNKNLKTIAKYVLDQGIGNRDGAIERWMTYTDKIYGSVFTTMPDGSCRLDMNEEYIRGMKGRYWGTENEFYGDSDYVIAEMGPLKNHPYQFLISSLRALQMRRNYMSITEMRAINHKDYKTQEFIKYLTLTMGKQIEDTSDAFVLMGERYIAASRLRDHMDADCVSKGGNEIKVRSFGRWLTESPKNTQVENRPVMKVRMPASENYWFQGFYLPDGIDYEYSAREAKRFDFDLNDKLSQLRCNDDCEVEVKVTFKDTAETALYIQVAEGKTQSLQTLGDNKIKTANFKIKSKFNNQLQSLGSSSDLSLNSDKGAIPLILMRINFLD